MTTQTEAMKLALECAERCEAIDGMYSWSATITAIKEALAAQERPQNCGTGYCSCIECVMEPEQEPVAWADHGVVNWIADKQFKHAALLYEAPQRTWVGLTDEEIDEIEEATWDKDDKSWGIHDFARAIEAKLRNKNT